MIHFEKWILKNDARWGFVTFSESVPKNWYNRFILHQTAKIYIKSALIIRQRFKLLSYRKSTLIIYYFENIFCGNVNNVDQIERTF